MMKEEKGADLTWGSLICILFFSSRILASPEFGLTGHCHELPLPMGTSEQYVNPNSHTPTSKANFIMNKCFIIWDQNKTEVLVFAIHLTSFINHAHN